MECVLQINSMLHAYFRRLFLNEYIINHQLSNMLIQYGLQLSVAITVIVATRGSRNQFKLLYNCQSLYSGYLSRFRPHCNRGDVMRFYVQHRLAVLTSLARSDQFSRPGIIAMSAVKPCRLDERALTTSSSFLCLLRWLADAQALCECSAYPMPIEGLSRQFTVGQCSYEFPHSIIHRPCF